MASRVTFLVCCFSFQINFLTNFLSKFSLNFACAATFAVRERVWGACGRVQWTILLSIVAYINWTVAAALIDICVRDEPQSRTWFFFFCAFNWFFLFPAADFSLLRTWPAWKWATNLHAARAACEVKSYWAINNARPNSKQTFYRHCRRQLTEKVFHLMWISLTLLPASLRLPSLPASCVKISINRLAFWHLPRAANRKM